MCTYKHMSGTKWNYTVYAQCESMYAHARPGATALARRSCFLPSIDRAWFLAYACVHVHICMCVCVHMHVYKVPFWSNASMCWL